MSAAAPDLVVGGGRVERLVSPESAIPLSGPQIGPARDRIRVGSGLAGFSACPRC